MNFYLLVLFPKAHSTLRLIYNFILDLVMNLSARPDIVVPLWPITALERRV